MTTVSEAKYAEAAGADVIIAQGMEAGGHRGAFDATKAEARMVGLFSLLPAAVDAVKIPVVAAGGIADGRGVGGNGHVELTGRTELQQRAELLMRPAES